MCILNGKMIFMQARDLIRCFAYEPLSIVVYIVFSCSNQLSLRPETHFPYLSFIYEFIN